MFLMRELPTREAFHAVSQQYPGMYSELDLSAVEACYFLLRTGSDLLANFEADLSRRGISQGRFVVLLLLLRSLGQWMSPSKLAEQAGVSRATMTRFLNGLERDGLIERIQDNGDRRMVSVRLTPQGRQTLENIFPSYHRRFGRAMEDLSDQERRLLIRLLSKVNAKIPALDEEEIREGTKMS